MSSQKCSYTFLTIVFLLFDVKVCRCDDELIRTALDEIYNRGGQDEDSKEKELVLRVWPKISGIISESVKIPGFRKNVGENEWSRQLLALEHPIYPFFICTTESRVELKVGDILSTKFENRQDQTICDVESELEFTNPVKFRIYAEDSHGKRSEPIPINYSFKGQNVIKFILIFPKLSEKREKITQDCICTIDSVSVITLSKPTVEVEPGKFEDIQGNDMGEQFWNIMKGEGEGIFKILNSSLMKALQSNLIEDKTRTSGKTFKTRVPWVCLSNNFDQSENVKGIPKQSTLSQLLAPMQLAIEQSVASISSSARKYVLMTDFPVVEKKGFTFNAPGMNGKKIKFFLTSYAPFAFKILRSYFGMNEEEFLASFCKDSLYEIPINSRSGSALFLSENKYLIAKTVRSKDVGMLQKFLPAYVLYLLQNPDSLLPKLHGLYWFKKSLFTSLGLLVMNNIMPTNTLINEKYDLKGSKVSRKLSDTQLQSTPPPITFKDIDFMNHFPQGIYLRADDYKKIMLSIQKDSSLLESFQIFDYSLLLGIHYEGQIKQREDVSYFKDEKNIPCERLDGGKFDSGKTNGRIDEKDSVKSGVPGWTPEGEELHLFLGIIDILEEYSFEKKIQYFLKSLVYKGNELSVQNPVLFARRFENFIGTDVFKMLPHCLAS